MKLITDEELIALQRKNDEFWDGLKEKVQEQHEEIERLNNIIKEIKELVDNYEKAEEVLGGKPRFQLHKLQEILDKGE